MNTSTAIPKPRKGAWGIKTAKSFSKTFFSKDKTKKLLEEIHERFKERKKNPNWKMETKEDLENIPGGFNSERKKELRDLFSGTGFKNFEDEFPEIKKIK